MGVFLTPKPSFTNFGDSDPCAGPARSQLEGGKDVQADLESREDLAKHARPRGA